MTADLGLLVPFLAELRASQAGHHGRPRRLHVLPRPRHPADIERAYGMALRALFLRRLAAVAERARHRLPELGEPGDLRADARRRVTQADLDEAIRKREAAERALAEQNERTERVKHEAEEAKASVRDLRRQRERVEEMRRRLEETEAETRAIERRLAAEDRKADRTRPPPGPRGATAEEIVEQARRSFGGSLDGTETIAHHALSAAGQRGRVELEGQLRSIRVRRVDPLRQEAGVADQLRKAIEENVALIQSVPERYFIAMGDEIYEGVQVGRRWETIAQRMTQRFETFGDPSGPLGIASRRFEMIARDQIGKAQSDLSRIRHQNLGIDRYIWRTALDERVRGNPTGRYPDADPSHYDREGEIFSYDDPPEDGNPGEPPLCRCTAEPVLADLLGGDPEVADHGPVAFDPLSFVRNPLGI